jgi:hypothetical protein
MKVVAIVFAILAVSLGFLGGAAIVSGANPDPVRVAAASAVGMVFGLAAITFAILAKKE